LLKFVNEFSKVVLIVATFRPKLNCSSSVEVLNINFHKNPSDRARVITLGETRRR